MINSQQINYVLILYNYVNLVKSADDTFVLAYISCNLWITNLSQRSMCTYLFTAFEPASTGTLLKDFTLIFGILATFPGRLALLIDAPAARHNTVFATPQKQTLSPHSQLILHWCFYVENTRKYFQNTLFLVTITKVARLDVTNVSSQTIICYTTQNRKPFILKM